MKKMNTSMVKKILAVTCASFVLLTGCATTTTTPEPEPAPQTSENADTAQPLEPEKKEPVVSSVKEEGYTLKEMVVLSRHNVRAPLSTKGSDLYRLTPHEWIEWSSDASELSLLGGNLETLMGQYFRKYLADKGLMEENEQPENDLVRFYSNSMQRTIATAQYFSSGFLPVANIDVEYHNEIGTMDPVFHPQFTFLNEAFEQKAMEEITAMGGEGGLQGIEKNLEENYKLLADVLNLKESDKAKEDGYAEFPTDDLEISFKLNAEPSMTGSLKVATTAADALVLQYYEEPDAVKAAFGKALTDEQWESIAHIKDVYGDVLFTAPSVAKNIANPMIKEIKSELENPSRKFTFLCGHDSNIASVLAALDFEKYALPNAIEKTTPIGSKIVMEKWANQDGEEFVTFKMVYLSVDQLRDLQIIDLNNPPMVYDLVLNGVDKNEDGMYTYADVITRLDETISEYDTLKGE